MAAGVFSNVRKDTLRAIVKYGTKEFAGYAYRHDVTLHVN